MISVRASFDRFGGMVTTKLRERTTRGQFKISPYAGNYSRMRAFPPKASRTSPREDDLDIDQGGGQEDDGPHATPRRLDPGQGGRSGDRPAGGRGHRAILPEQSIPGDVVHGFEAIVATKDDGSYQVAVPPGKGYLMILGPTLDYLPEEIGGGTLFGSGQRGGKRYYAHNAIAYEVKSGDKPMTSRPRYGRAGRFGAACLARRGRRSRTQ